MAAERDGQRRKAATALALSALLLAALDIGGRALDVVHLWDCDLEPPQYVVFLSLAVLGCAAASASVLYGSVAARTPGRGRVLAPALGVAATIVSVAVLIDVLTPPILNCIK